LLFIYGQRSDAFVETVAEKVLYALWDTGLSVGHALRAPRECLKLAGSDLTVRTALLDTRWLAGDQALYGEFSAAASREVLKRNAGRFFRAKAAESAERHRKYGDSVFVVEPHVKEGEGGLRDLHTALWLAKVKYVVRELAELVAKGVLTEAEYAEIRAAQDFLWRVRNGLHFRSGGYQDQLTFEYQERVAEDLGYRDQPTARGVEQFMRTYYWQARVIHRFADNLISRCLERSAPYRLIGRLGGRQIRPGVRIAGNELVVGDPATVRAAPSLLLRLFADAQRHGVPLSAATRRLVRAHAHLVDEGVRTDPVAIRAFLDILGWPHGVGAALHEMHELDVLDAFLPEFAHLLCLAQYDRYHIYTADEHTLRAVARLEQLLHGEFKQSAPLFTQVMRDIDRREVLYLAMLFHDIGKGLGGDHSSTGAALAHAVGDRLGLNADDRAQFELLVRQHLLMHHLATRRDIHDPKLVREFARSVGTAATLQKLFVLTFADLGATNPQLWNSWQDMLLSELYTLTVDHLESGASVEDAPEERASRIRERVRAAVGPAAGAALQRFLADLPDHYFLGTPEEDIARHFELVQRAADDPLVTRVVHFPEREFSEFTVVTRDAPGLFAKLTGVLRAVGMNIAAARIATGASGMVVDVFRVTHLGDGDPARDEERWERVHTAVGKALSGALDVEQMVAAAARPSVLDEKVVPRLPTRVEIDNRVSADYTVIDVYMTDRAGVLFAITNALYHLGLSIHLAKITTSVDRVLDVFYVSDRYGRKIEDAATLALIRSTLLQAIQPVTCRGVGLTGDQ
jgi:[protein-PII] uridylyltransferase